MKAIELLKDYKNIDFGCNVEELHNEIDEAIKELEDFLKRNCSNCKFVGYFSPHESLECQNNDCNFYSNDVDIFTSCNKWEAK